MESLQENQVSLPSSLLRFDPSALNQLKRKIIVNLGAGRVKVELTEEQLNFAIDEAIEMIVPYFAHRNFVYYVMQVNPGQVEYDLPQGTRIVQDVIYDPANSVLTSGSIFNNQLYALGYGVDTATFTMLLMNIETARKVYSKIRTWELTDNNKIRISPVPDVANTAILKIIGSISSISSDQYNWISRYAQGQAQVILGRIRSKFSNIPSSQGQVNFDGEAMKQEGETLKQQVIEEVRMRNPVYAFTTG